MFGKTVLALLAVAASALAQGITITQPTDLATVAPGSNITVQVTRPDTLTGSQEVAVVVALASCAGYSNGCGSFDVSQRLGTVLYAGGYSPQFADGGFENQPFQNFTVTVPENFQTGEASLTASHFSLIGAGPYPNLEVKNITLNIQS